LSFAALAAPIVAPDIKRTAQNSTNAITANSQPAGSNAHAHPHTALKVSMTIRSLWVRRRNVCPAAPVCRK
jgi:hypothetical protein